MRRLFAFMVLIFALGSSARAAEGRILKVLPQFLDDQGRASTSPSLYDRDAYQAFLRRNPLKRSTIRFVVQWKARNAADEPLRIRVEMIGAAKTGLPPQTSIEMPVRERGWFSHWAYITMSAEQYKQFGDVTAWRVTLMDGDKQLAEQKSFLWQ
jgi:hypothetical protein